MSTIELSKKYLQSVMQGIDTKTATEDLSWLMHFLDNGDVTHQEIGVSREVMEFWREFYNSRMAFENAITPPWVM